MSKSGVAALGPTCQLLQQMSKPGVAAPLDTGQRRDGQGHPGKGQRAVAGHGGVGGVQVPAQRELGVVEEREEGDSGGGQQQQEEQQQTFQRRTACQQRQCSSRQLKSTWYVTA